MISKKIDYISLNTSKAVLDLHFWTDETYLQFIGEKIKTDYENNKNSTN